MFGQGLNFGGLIGTAALNIDFLVVAGGGGGGPNHGGGGGAGGYKTTTTYSGSETPLVGILGTAYDVTVGPGGAGALAGVNGTSGSNSNFNGIISTGGGGGAPNNGAGVTGGSGGGGSRGGGGGSGTTGQGNDGATGTSLSGGGGGGANTAGSNGSSSNNGGNGGDGISNSISGTSTPYAGGGGGNGYEGSGGTGGTGGGGNGGQYGGAGEYVGTNGTFNTGGGGGGSYSNSGTFQLRGMNGGSGTVILRYPTASVSSYAVTGTLDTTADTAYPIANRAYYKLDANVNDSSGNGFNATESGITYTSGRFGNAATYSGTNASTGSKIYVSNSVYGASTSIFSVSLWVKCTNTVGEIPLSGNGGTIGGTQGYALYLNSGSLALTFRSSNGSQNFYYGSPINDNAWHHVVLTFNNGPYAVYLDGTVDFSGTTGNFLSNTTPSFDTYFGNRWGRNENGVIAGQMDQIRIFNSAITAGNVTSLYNEGTVVESTDGTDSILQFTGGSGDITFS